MEVTLSTSNDTIIKSVLIFAEGIFEVRQLSNYICVMTVTVTVCRVRATLFILKK